MLSFTRHGNLENPPLIFLHGFLGVKEDWEETILHLQADFSCYCFDLPGHGNSILNEEHILETIHESIQKISLRPFTAIGYSLGGRILLMLAKKYPYLYERLILIGANLGILDENEKKQRLQTDLQWIEMLKTKPLAHFLEHWYQQPLFDSLKKKQDLYQKILKRRLEQNPQNLIRLIEVFSLSKQPFFDCFSSTTFFVYGEEDLKYKTLYDKFVQADHLYKVNKCGHTVHLENPQGCADLIKNLCEVLI